MHADMERVAGEKMMLNFGPQHPATHGTLRIVLELDGETVVKATPHLGYLHTGFEKLGEHLDYNQYIVVTDRMNYLSPLSNNFGYVLAVEKLLGLEIPKRGEYVRVIMAELSRLADHLIWLGMGALDLGAFTAFLYGFKEREKLYSIFEKTTGARLTTSYTRVGGVLRDLYDGFEEEVNAFLSAFPKTLKEVHTLLTRNRIWMDRTKEVGVISGEDAISYGLTGPCLRASGVGHDLRKAEPYSSYEDFDFDVAVGDNGDVYDRYLVRMEEMVQSCHIVRQAMDNLPDGPVNVPDNKIMLPEKKDAYGHIEGLIHHFKIIMDGHGVQPPRGEIYSATESPNGELGFYIVSDGSGTAYRIRIRPPSLLQYQVVPHMIEGGMVSDVVAVLGSLNVIAGELDR
ncbi:MAG: NADH dehydrogenase (quinone) subunit D [Candidatus Poribacteria bacterium]|nr:NADH dehydrogenase (quinone) subunit D [Candidatus Poribacteria bacterium]